MSWHLYTLFATTSNSQKQVKDSDVAYKQKLTRSEKLIIAECRGFVKYKWANHHFMDSC